MIYILGIPTFCFIIVFFPNENSVCKFFLEFLSKLERKLYFIDKLYFVKKVIVIFIIFVLGYVFKFKSVRIKQQTFIYLYFFNKIKFRSSFSFRKIQFSSDYCLTDVFSSIYGLVLLADFKFDKEIYTWIPNFRSFNLNKCPCHYWN